MYELINRQEITEGVVLHGRTNTNDQFMPRVGGISQMYFSAN